MIAMPDEDISKTLTQVYQRLLRAYGRQSWWPAEGPFEVMVGAILTQSAAWGNVETAIINLKKAGALTAKALREISESDLAGLIHSCGYYNAKAVKLKALARWMEENWGDSLEKMFARDWEPLREALLGVHGVGEETADSILLYAGNKPVFVIDAYTRRIVERLGLRPKGGKYGDYQRLFMNSLPQDPALFNEYHALLVALGKNVCKQSKPQCRECPLTKGCLFSSGLMR
jgi:endonuclease III related protein